VSNRVRDETQEGVQQRTRPSVPQRPSHHRRNRRRDQVREEVPGRLRDGVQEHPGVDVIKLSSLSFAQASALPSNIRPRC